MDQSYTGSSSDGSYKSPFRTINAALSSVTLGEAGREKIFHVFPGVYTEDLTFSKAVSVVIEGGTYGFTLKPSTGIIVQSSSGVKFSGFTIDGSACPNTLIQTSSGDFTMTSMTVTDNNAVLNAGSTGLSLLDSGFTSTVTTSPVIYASNATVFQAVSLTVSGGSHGMHLKNSSSAEISSVSFSSFQTTGLFLEDGKNPKLKSVKISSLPNLNTDTGGIKVQNITGGRIDDAIITGSGSVNPPCAAGRLENGIYLVSQTGMTIENPVISSVGCSGIKVTGSRDIIVARFQLNSNGRGVHFKTSYADLFQGTIDGSREAAAFMEDSFSAIDLSKLNNSTNGPGLKVTNTTSGTDTGYFIGNSTVFSGNANQGILISGNSVSGGFRVTIRVTTFSNNGNPTWYAIESDQPNVPADFICKDNVFSSQTNTIHPNLDAGLGRSNCTN